MTEIIPAPYEPKALDPSRLGPWGTVPPLPIEVECGAFRGSLPLLLQAVRGNKVDLMGVPVAPICEAYLIYLLESNPLDLDASASALMALSYLVERKAWGLIPCDELEPEADPDQLPMLASIDLYDDAILTLLDQADRRDRLHFRQVDAREQYELPMDLGDIAPSDLAQCLERLLRRAKPDRQDLPMRPRRNLSDQMGLVMRTLTQQPLPLDDLVEGEFTRTEAVWWFLALLELIRLGQARVDHQGDAFAFARIAA